MGGLELSEYGLQGEDSLADGTYGLVFLFAPRLPRCKELTPRVEAAVKCPACGRLRDELPANPEIKLALPPPLFTPGLFSPGNSSVRIISGELLTALRDVGLDAGLDVFPVEVTTPTEDDYFGIRVPVALDWEAAPYGCSKHDVPCSVCGSRFPRFAFYPTFDRPAEPLDWMSTPMNGPSGLYVTARVYEWLTGPGRHLAGKTTNGDTVDGWRAGWFPDDLDKAFLPERFRGEADGPVEPLQPGEYPWFER